MAFRRKRQPASTLAENSCVLEEEVFAELLERERLRAERSLRTFCLLHVGEASRLSELEPVTQRLDDGAIRRTDAAGWFRNGIGVMLPETELEGAEHVRAKLCDGLDVICRIYVFPSDRLPEMGQPLEQNQEQDQELATIDHKLSDNHQPQPQPLESLMTIHDSFGKRAVDIAGSSAGLVLLSPLILLAMLLVKLTSRGPILFSQLRAGHGGRPFKMYKLRTMVIDAEDLQESLRSASEQDGPAFKLRHDPRVTWIGRYLRKSCIDELPQLLNVLLGHMSLVGPRPLPLKESAQITSWARGRLRVKPGLTCIWQVEGGAHVKFIDWMRMDLRYIQRRTLLHDFRLIAKTAANVLMHRAST